MTIAPTNGEASKSRLILGNCLEELPKLEANSIDTCITDPPYELGFMGKSWDSSGVAFDPETWRAVFRVLKPGAFLLCFGGTRTFHRITCAIEDAGFEVRDCMMWLYGSGFPKSLDISKAIDKAAGAEREVIGQSPNWRESKRNREEFGSMEVRGENAGLITAPSTESAKLWDGWGTALKPAWEPIIVAMKPCDGTFAENALRHGVAGLNIDGGRIATTDDLSNGVVSSEARSTFATGTVRTETHQGGRFPANLVLDEEAAATLDEQTGTLTSGKPAGMKAGGKLHCYGEFAGGIPVTGFGDSGGASRFFYCAKASRSERNAGLEGMPEFLPLGANGSPNAVGATRGSLSKPRANYHPTVKPLKLMEYLCTLTKTPTGGIVLDPFMGSGSTGVAALRTGRDFVGIEMTPEYMEIAQARIKSTPSVETTAPNASPETEQQTENQQLGLFAA